MKIIETTLLSQQQKETICSLWNREYPHQLALTSAGFENFLKKSTRHHHFLILDDVNAIIGWAFTFDRGEDRWFSIIIHDQYQKMGLGRMILNLLKEKEPRLNGWVSDQPHELKQNGELYISPLDFYIKNDFRVCKDIRYQDEKLSAVKIEWRKK